MADKPTYQDFPTLTRKEASQLVQFPDWAEAARRFVGRHRDGDGDIDHWQSGDGYTGRKPTSDTTGASVYMSSLEDAFIVEDLCSDVLSHRTSGVLGKDPNWRFDTEGEDASPEEEARQEAVERWWNDNDVREVMEDFASGIGTEAKYYLRFRITGADEISASTPEDALAHIYVEAIGRENATVYTDPDLKELGVFKCNTSGAGKHAEVTYLDENQQTVLRLLGNDREEGWTGDLGGKLFIYEGTGRLLMNKGMRSNQASLNTKRTWIEIVDEKAGFPELHLVGIQTPKDAKGNDKKPERGPGRLVYHVQIPKKTEGRNGAVEERSGRGQLEQFGAADTENLRADCDESREAIHRAANQLHRLISGDATASGESRIQARADYVSDLAQLKGTVDKAGTWVLETAWALAEALSGTDHSGATATFDAILDPGPITSEERRAMLEEVGKGAMSLKRFLSVVGVDDPDSEVQQIEEEMKKGIAGAQTLQALFFGTRTVPLTTDAEVEFVKAIYERYGIGADEEAIRERVEQSRANVEQQEALEAEVFGGAA